MKKSLIALAVLGAMVGAAQAQSSVTLYGKIDLGLVHSDPFGGTSNLEMKKSFSGSRWGLMGSEDLGGGLKVNFQLEQGFTADDGRATDSSKQFSRQSWVGLSGGFGEVRVGMPYTAYDDVSGAINSMWDSDFSVENTNNFFHTTTYRTPGNTIRYSTPSFGGFTGTASYSLDEVKNFDSATGSISLAYANGPVAVGFGYQVEGNETALFPNASDRKITRLSASYDFGVVVLKGLYGNEKIGPAKTDEYSIGVDVPLSGAFSLSAGYGYSKDKGAAGREKRKGFTAGGLYTLSKRTDVYFGVTDWDGKTSGVKTNGDTKYGFGMRHSF
eukprot:TRINITY_DN25867_c0_g1_i1.p1 TRINITY_DN25867_c0_g1~~TRINITY_DN25867_c0_g1_i1.p1  ORF type:complete len:328 (+),score=46.82 TRINITY_DN25867_c0_g1_i1:88-1071(+)